MSRIETVVQIIHKMTKSWFKNGCHGWNCIPPPEGMLKSWYQHLKMAYLEIELSVWLVQVRSCWNKVGPNPIWPMSLNKCSHVRTDREEPIWREDWHDVSMTQAVEHQRLPEKHQHLGKGKEGFPWRFQREHGPATPWYWTSGHRNIVTMYFCRMSSCLWCFVAMDWKTNTVGTRLE